jgi:hypothetical protein
VTAVTRLSKLDLREPIDDGLVVLPLLCRRRAAFDVRLDDDVISRLYVLVRSPKDLRGLGPVVVVPVPPIGIFVRDVRTVAGVINQPLTPRLGALEDVRVVFKNRYPLDVSAVTYRDLLSRLSVPELRSTRCE